MLSTAIGAVLRADGPRASVLLDSLKQLASDSVVRQVANCMSGRLSGGETAPTRDSADLVERTLRLYRAYWSRSVAEPESRQAQSTALMAALRKLLVLADTTSISLVEQRLDDSLSRLGVRSLSGRTGLLHEMMIWRKQRDTTYHLLLPEGRQDVRVVFLEEFESLGWSSYFTCNRSGTGGWTRPDGLFVVVPNYRSTTDETFRVNFLAHEGQHYMDKGQFPNLEPWELEYRAKLVELATADSTAAKTLDSFQRSQGADLRDAHAYANRAVLAAIRKRVGRTSDASLREVPRTEIVQAALTALHDDTRERRAPKPQTPQRRAE